jgi:hypothetical protein
LKRIIVLIEEVEAREPKITLPPATPGPLPFKPAIRLMVDAAPTMDIRALMFKFRPAFKLKLDAAPAAVDQIADDAFTSRPAMIDI